MAIRTNETRITLAHPFTVDSLGTPLPAGTYRLVTEEEEIPGISFLAFRRTATILYAPALSGKGGGPQQAIPTSPEEMTVIFDRDKQAIA